MSVPKCKHCEYQDYSSDGLGARKLRHGCKHEERRTFMWLSINEGIGDFKEE